MQIKNLLLTLCAFMILASTTILAANRVTVYTTLDEADARGLFKAFTKETGIKVDWVRLSTGEAVARLEAEKNNPQATLWVGGVGVGHIDAKNKGLTTPYFSPAAQHIPANFKDKDGYWTGLYAGALCFVSNTKRLKKYGLTAPKSWAELADPKYKGHIRFANPGSSGTAYNILATLVHLYGEEEAFEMMKNLDKNITLYTRSGSAPSRQAGLGEITTAVGYSHGAVRLVHQGYPLEITCPSEGTGYEVASISWVKNGSASEQKDAAILYDWMLGKKAAELLAKNFVTPFAQGIDLPEGAISIDAVNTIAQDDEWSAKNRRRLVEKWNQMIGGTDQTKTVTNKGDKVLGLPKKK